MSVCPECTTPKSLRTLPNSPSPSPSRLCPYQDIDADQIWRRPKGPRKLVCIDKADELLMHVLKQKATAPVLCPVLARVSPASFWDKLPCRNPSSWDSSFLFWCSSVSAYNAGQFFPSKLNKLAVGRRSCIKKQTIFGVTSPIHRLQQQHWPAL